MDNDVLLNRWAPTDSEEGVLETHAPPVAIRRRGVGGRERAQDNLFRWICRLFALSVPGLLLGILVALLVGAWPALKVFGPGFLTEVEWNPVTDRFGAAVPIFGTLITSGIALLIAVPVSFGIALFLSELTGTAMRRAIPDVIRVP